MPRRSILSVTERESIFLLPESEDELIRLYTLNESDLSVIFQHRGADNRLGFAIQLCYMRYPSVIFGVKDIPHQPLLQIIAKQLKIDPNVWSDYGKREKTRRDHLLELQTIFGFKPFSMAHYRPSVNMLENMARDTDKGIILANTLVAHLRSHNILLPSLNVIEQICAEAITLANRAIYADLTNDLTTEHKYKLDALLQMKEGTKLSLLSWLRQSPSKPNSVHMNRHIDRLKIFLDVDLPSGIERSVHQNRLLKIAREGGQMSYT